MQTDYYKIMGLSQQATTGEIRERYRSLMAGGHPDKFLDPGEKSRAEERIKQLNEAYDVLRNPARRAAFDRLLSNRRMQGNIPVVERSAPSKRTTSPVTPLDDPIEAFPLSRSKVHMHRTVYARRGDQVQVWLNRRANVFLLDGEGYQRYRHGLEFHYQGGYARYSPVSLMVPDTGWWHLVIDIADEPGHLQAGARLITGEWR